MCFGGELERDQSGAFTVCSAGLLVGLDDSKSARDLYVCMYGCSVEFLLKCFVFLAVVRFLARRLGHLLSKPLPSGNSTQVLLELVALDVSPLSEYLYT